MVRHLAYVLKFVIKKVISPLKFFASTKQPASIKATTISLVLAQCKGVPPFFISWKQNKNKLLEMFFQKLFEIELMVWGRTKIVEKILQKINCVSSCSKMGANIYPTLKKGDKFCPTSSSKNNYSLEKCRFSTVKSNRKSTFNTWM